jgi:YVTN family beta-propeller protein
MQTRQLAVALTVGSLLTAPAFAAPGGRDRVYTADQNSNTVSVINPLTNTLLGQIKLGNQRPDVLSPLYKGEINVHGLGFSPDHKTLIAISNGSNSVAFIDTATNKVKGVTYIGRSPHEGFFTADGRGGCRAANYISVIDRARSRRKTDRTTAGPVWCSFRTANWPSSSSFNPVVDVIDINRTKSSSTSCRQPFSPFLQFTPDFKEMWMSHKDVGKVTRIDTATLKVKGVFDTGFITNHVAFARTAAGTRAYITIGGENAVKVYTTDATPALVATIPTGALPHGIWSSDDGTRLYVGLENGDAVDVIDSASNKVTARVPVGQAPQALVYLSNAVPQGDGMANLIPRANSEPINIALKPAAGEAKGFIVARNLGVVDSLEVSLFKLKPQTVYSVYVTGQDAPVASFKTNPKGMANGTAIGPMRNVSNSLNPSSVTASRVLVMEADVPADPKKAVLSSVQ